MDCLTLEDGTDTFYRNFAKYQYSLRSIPESEDLKNTQWGGNVPSYVRRVTCFVREDGEQI